MPALCQATRMNPCCGPSCRSRCRGPRVTAINGPQQPFQLPGGGEWRVGLASATSADAVVYGPGFLLNRYSGRVGQQGLVRRPSQPPLQRYGAVPAPPPTAAIVPIPAAPHELSLSLAAGAVVIDTEFEVVAAPGDVELDGATCLSLVPLASAEHTAAAQADQQGPTASGKHPRRTMTVRFSCNLCGTSNTSLVNPHAWNNGSVFCRCSGCTAVHKLRDNLGIFCELREVFPPRELHANLLSPEVMAALEKIRRANQN